MYKVNSDAREHKREEHIFENLLGAIITKIFEMIFTAKFCTFRTSKSCLFWPSRGQSEMVGAAWNHLAKKSVPKILLLSRLALENTNLQIYHLWWLTMNYQAYFCRFEQRTSNCTVNINFVVKIFDKRFWFWEEINIWINFSERPIKKIPKSDKIKFLARLNQKLQEGGISKSSVSLVRVGQV